MIFLFETWVDTFSKNNYWEDIIIWHAKQTLFVFKNWKDCARTLILGEKQPKSAHFLQAKMVELKEAKKWIFCSSGKYWLTFWWYASLLSGSTIWEIERERLKSWGKGWGFFGSMVLKTQKSSFFLVSNIGFFVQHLGVDGDDFSSSASHHHHSFQAFRQHLEILHICKT